MHTERQERWRETHLLTPDKGARRTVLEEIRRGRDVTKTLRSHPIRGGGYLNKSMLVAIYKEMVAAGELEEDARLLERIRMKPMRTLSGVITVTVLTKPYPCPGKCIFCPTDVRMPKSYLPDEPGAMRGLEHQFDPYAQVRSRMDQLLSLGHPTDKTELLILGGTWSSYRRDYQEWFVKRCFDVRSRKATHRPISTSACVWNVAPVSVTVPPRRSSGSTRARWMKRLLHIPSFRSLPPDRLCIALHHRTRYA